MPVRIPKPRWPDELTEVGPDEDPSILLTGEVEVGATVHRLLAVRVSCDTLRVDFQTDLGDGVYEAYELEQLLDELEFFSDSNQRASLVVLESGSYVVWMIPYAARQARLLA